MRPRPSWEHEPAAFFPILMSRFRQILFAVSGLSAPLWAVVFFSVLRSQGDPDYWWHLRIGEWIASHGTVPHTALLSWLTHGPWTAHEWAGELLLYWLHELSGPYGSIVLLGAVNLGAVLLMISVVRLLRPASSHLTLGILAVTAVFVATAIWSPRLQAFDLLFGLLALRTALGYLEHGERRGLWLMPLAMLAWVNLHGGGVSIYLLVMAAVLAGEWWNRRNAPGAVMRPWRPLLVSFAASLLVQSLNPVGPAIYLYPLATVASPAMQNLIVEWQSPDFHAVIFRFAQAFLALGLVGLLAFVRVRDARAILLNVGFVFMFLQSGRYVGFLALVALGVSAPWLLAAAEELWQTTVGRPFFWREPRWRWPVLRVGTALLVLALVVGRIASLPAEQARALMQSQPVAAADWLDTHPQPGRLFNDYDWGGYLAWRLRVEVGFYGAADAFGDAALEEVGHLIRLEVDPRPYLDAHQVATVITRPNEPLGHWLAEAAGWQNVYSNGVAVVFRRAPSTP